MSARILTAVAFCSALALVPRAYAEDWHRHGWHHGDNGAAVGAAIAGGIIGLGLAAAASNPYNYYYAPPPVYYGYPYSYYYAPPPPAYYPYGY